MGGQKIFVNPPYTRGQIEQWIKKGYEESKKPNTIVVMLLPARTSNKWFNEYCMKATEIHFVVGRLTFGGAETGAPFPSMVVCFIDGKEKEHSGPEVYTIGRNKEEII